MGLLLLLTDHNKALIVPDIMVVEGKVEKENRAEAAQGIEEEEQEGVKFLFLTKSV
jgi:hypothetical protein